MEMYKRLIEVAKEKNTSIWKVLDKLGISRGIMSSLKAGRSKSISQSNLEKIARELGVSINYLIYGEESSTVESPSLDDIAYSLYNSLDDLSPEERDRKVREILPELVRRMKE